MSATELQPAGTLRSSVESVVRTAATVTAGTPLAQEVEAARARLAEPLRVAIAGRVKAGKSTLLNALVGERLAPTDAGESTKIVTLYQEGLNYVVRALLKDGGSEELGFTRNDGALRIDLGARAAAEIDRLEVTWPSSALRELTLIDTPGLASINDENSLRTREFLALEEDRSSEADAVIYLMRHMHRSDHEFLESFLDRSMGNVSPVNAVAVLSRADEIGACRIDAIDSAKRIADRYRTDESLRGLCATVIPLAGLVAETGLTLREHEFASLRALASMETDALRMLLLSADRFADPGVEGVTVETRRQLLDRFGLFGLRLSLSAMKEGRVSTAPQLSALLVGASGLPELRRVLREAFQPRAEVLKARSTLVALGAVARRLRADDPLGAMDLEAAIERVSAGAHQLAELRLAHLAMTRAARFSDDEVSEVQRLTTAASPHARAGLDPDAPRDVVEATALQGIERWRGRAEDPLADRITAEAASILVRSYEGIYAAARAAA